MPPTTTQPRITPNIPHLTEGGLDELGVARRTAFTSCLVTKVTMGKLLNSINQKPFLVNVMKCPQSFNALIYNNINIS
jgi:hypothetical protein